MLMVRWRRALCCTAFVVFSAVGFFQVLQYLGREAQRLHFITVSPQTNVEMVLRKLTISIHLVLTR